MIQDRFKLDGRTALITGGSKGIGKAMARAFAESGADIAISARHEDELQAAAKEIGDGLDVRVEYFVCDMTNRQQSDDMAAAAVDRLGKVDILINNAGSNVPQMLQETTDETWDQIIELNLTSCMRLSRALVGGMIERKWGRIIHLSSIMGLASFQARGSYSATKSALLGLMRAHALELGRHGITVNCLAPGPIMTDLPMSLLSDEKKEEFARLTAVKRWGQPIDIAGPALLLASEAGAFVSGDVLVIDGGLLCRTFTDN